MRLLLAGLAVVLAASVGEAAAAAVGSGCSVPWWPQPRQSSCGTGSAVNDAAPSPGNVARLELAWTHETGTGLPLPIVWKGPKTRTPLVYLGAGKELRALDLSTGTLRWKARGSSARPVADADLLLQLTGAVVRRYVPRSGHIVWQRTLRVDGYGEPIAAGGNFYIETSDGQILALDERTGRRRWQRWFGCFNCRLAAEGDRLYAAGTADDSEGNGKGRLYALDARSGATIWSSGTGADYTTGASPIAVGGRVFVRTMGGKYLAREFSVEAFDAATGRHLWHASVGTSKRFWFGPLAADRNTVVYPSEDGNLYALDAATGAVRWRMRRHENGVMPAIVNGIVWASDIDGRLIAHDGRNGRALWTSEQLWKMSDAFSGTPGIAVAGPYVLAGTTDGRLLAYHVPS